MSCFFESVRTCPECRLEWFSQSVVVFSCLFSPLDVRTHPEYRLECFCQSFVVCHVSLRLLEHVQNADWNSFVSQGVVFHVSLRLLEHVENAD